MHVAVVGAGALGRAHGVRLASRAGTSVSFVVRASRLAHERDAQIRIESVEGGEADAIEAPVWVTAVPRDADLVLACVGSDQLDAAIDEHLAGVDAEVVALCPMLPKTYARARARLGERLLAGMPSVTGYVRADGVTRYWLSRTARMQIDEPRVPSPSVSALVDELGRAGIATTLAKGVHETNPATTMMFLPLTFGLDIAGSFDALLADAELLDLMFRASDEARALAERVGKVAFWVGLIARFGGPYTIKVGVGLGRKRSPEAMAFVERRFGREVHAQGLAMAEEVVAIAADKGTPHAAIAELLARLRRV